MSSHHDPHFEEREGPKEGKQFLVSYSVKVSGEDHRKNCESALEVVSGNGRPPCFRTQDSGSLATQKIKSFYLSQEIEDAFQEQRLVLVS